MRPNITFSPPLEQVRDSAIFYTYMSILVIGFIYAIVAVTRRESAVTGFVLVPTLCLCLWYENLTIAIVADVVDPASIGSEKLRAAVQSFVIPLFLVTLFELNYEIHKRRSVNFFGCIKFDSGHRTSTGFFGNLVRFSIWLIAMAVMLIQVVVNAPYITNPLLFPETTRFTSKGIDITQYTPPFTWSDAVDFFPYLLLVLFALYTGISLWRYGTSISTDVRATSINPWASTFIASVGLILAWLLTPISWPLPFAMNAMEIVLLFSMIIDLYLVEMNLKTLELWEQNLQSANEAVIAAIAARDKQAEMEARYAATAAIAAAAARAAGFGGFSEGKTPIGLQGDAANALIRRRGNAHASSGSASSGTSRPPLSRKSYPSEEDDDDEQSVSFSNPMYSSSSTGAAASRLPGKGPASIELPVRLPRPNEEAIGVADVSSVGGRPRKNSASVATKGAFASGVLSPPSSLSQVHRSSSGTSLAALPSPTPSIAEVVTAARLESYNQSHARQLSAQAAATASAHVRSPSILSRLQSNLSGSGASSQQLPRPPLPPAISALPLAASAVSAAASGDGNRDSEEDEEDHVHEAPVVSTVSDAMKKAGSAGSRHGSVVEDDLAGMEDRMAPRKSFIWER
jgi:hypothetical protein